MTNYRTTRSAMAAIWLALAIGMLAGQAVLAQGKTQTLTGTVSDSVCGAMHPEKDTKMCVATCIKTEGADYALVVGGKVYTLKGKTAGLDKLAGAKAKVTGMVDGDIMQVASFAAA